MSQDLVDIRQLSEVRENNLKQAEHGSSATVWLHGALTVEPCAEGASFKGDAEHVEKAEAGVLVVPKQPFSHRPSTMFSMQRGCAPNVLKCPFLLSSIHDIQRTKSCVQCPHVQNAHPHWVLVIHSDSHPLLSFCTIQTGSDPLPIAHCPASCFQKKT